MKTSFKFVAEKAGLTTIIVEPWSEEYRLNPLAQYSFEFDAQSTDAVEINVVEPYLIVTAPQRSICELRENGVHISQGRMINRSP